MKMLGSFRKDKKDEESGSGIPSVVEKAQILQEARTFNETPINPRKCVQILTKILYMINQGETLSAREATEAFFAMTKLFQSKDNNLRRMVYLCIKEMASIAEDVIIVTSSLTKDMTGKEDSYRGPAIRALCKITDHSMLQSIERYMKQAIVDKLPSVASAALLSSLHLSKHSPEVVKRWVNEVQEAANTDNIMVQYHALGVLYYIKKNDVLAVNKLVSKLKSNLKSPYAHCFLIRVACKVLEEESGGRESPMFAFVEQSLRHKSEMVIYEAAHAIVNMKFITAAELAPAVSVLQLFCSSPKPVLRFAAVKTLNRVAISHPAAVTACNLDLENLITDSNRSIATLAITTLLKTGNEGSVDRLMKQITGFMNEISDEFKIVVVSAVNSLCHKFPRKHAALLSFLSNMLREEGGFEYKRAIVETVITIIEENVEARDTGLSHLCEFIEDCEHTSLATRILHLLGREGPKTATPAKFIRFIYNRIILEHPAVRSAAVTSLAKFGGTSDELLPNILIILQRAMLDADDEVRDRATFYYHVLCQRQKALNSAYILNGLNVSIIGLEKALHQYTLEPSEKPFDLRTVPIEIQQVAESALKKVAAATGDQVSKTPEPAKATRQDIYAEQLAAIPEFARLGPLFRSSTMPKELTETGTEYTVSCVKHLFQGHIVFQFNCVNTLNDQLLERCRVKVETADGFEFVCFVPCPKLVYQVTGTTYTLFKLPEDPGAVTGTFGCTFQFIVKDCDPNTGEPDDDEGYEDEYQLEDVELSVGDHVQKVMKPNFGASWEEVGPECEVEDTYALATMSSLEEAVTNIVQFMGMQPCERTEKVAEGKSSHTLLLAGVFRGGHDVLVRAKLALVTADGDPSVTMQLTVRSTDQIVSEIIATAAG